MDNAELNGNNTDTIESDAGATADPKAGGKSDTKSDAKHDVKPDRLDVAVMCSIHPKG